MIVNILFYVFAAVLVIAALGVITARNPVHCAERANDGMVYVCDRPNDRLQIFTSDGKFVKEAFYQRDSLGDGSVWDVAFSRDPQQRYLYMSDGRNAKITPFLTGFLNPDDSFNGRPAYIHQQPDGSLLISDDYVGAIYRVTYSAN